jgi:gluconolactonase
MIKYFKYTAFVLLCLLSLSSFSQSVADTNIIVKGMVPQLVSSQFLFTEGPAVDKAGNVFYRSAQ